MPSSMSELMSLPDLASYDSFSISPPSTTGTISKPKWRAKA